MLDINYFNHIRSRKAPDLLICEVFRQSNNSKNDNPPPTLFIHWRAWLDKLPPTQKPALGDRMITGCSGRVL